MSRDTYSGPTCDFDGWGDLCESWAYEFWLVKSTRPGDAGKGPVPIACCKEHPLSSFGYRDTDAEPISEDEFLVMNVLWE